MEKEKKKEQSFVNEDLNEAFIEGDLNKTVTNNSIENSNWNLLDDPAMEVVKHENEEEEDNYDNFLDVSEKDMKPSSRNIGGLESSIQFNSNSLMMSKMNCSKKKVEEEDDEDLKDLLSEVGLGHKSSK